MVRARAHRPDLCLPNVGWHQISDRGVAQYAVEGGFSVPFRHVAFAHRRSGAVAHTFFCLQEDQLHVRPVPEPSTWVAGALAFAALAYTQRRRFTRMLRRA